MGIRNEYFKKKVRFFSSIKGENTTTSVFVTVVLAVR